MRNEPPKNNQRSWEPREHVPKSCTDRPTERQAGGQRERSDDKSKDRADCEQKFALRIGSDISMLYLQGETTGKRSLPDETVPEKEVASKAEDNKR